jgi:TP901 family phage tail tape measure protein
MAENVVVTINVKDFGSEKVGKFAKNTKTQLASVGGTVKTTSGVFANFTKTLAGNTAAAFSVLPAYAAVGAVLGGVTATVGLAIKDIVEFDKALRRASSIQPELSGRFKEIRQDIIALDPALGTTAQIADGLFEALSSGITIGEDLQTSLKFTADAAKLAKAALIAQDVSVRTLSTTLQAFGADISRATEFSDIFNKAVVIGQFTGEELTNVLGRVTPIAAQLGISFSEVAGTLATLSQGGLNAAESVTAFRQILNQAINQSDNFRDAGIDVIKTLAGKDGVVSFFKQLREATGGNTEQLKTFIKSVRGLNGAAILTGNLFEKLAGNIKLSGEATGETARQMTENQKSISAGFDRLSASFDRAAQKLSSSTFGEALSDSLTSLGRVIENGAENITTFVGAISIAASETDKVLGVTDALGSNFGDIAVKAAKAGTPIGQINISLKLLRNIVAPLTSGIGDLSNKLELTAAEAEKFGNDLKRGGIRAQEALNSILKARNAATLAAKVQIQTDNESIDVLENLARVADSVSGRFDAQGNAVTNATQSLRGLGVVALDVGSAQEQLEKRLVNLITGADNFGNRLTALAGGLTKNLELTGDAATGVNDLAIRFGQSVNSLNTWREALREAGASASELSGQTSFTKDSLLRMSEASGLSVNSLDSLVRQFINATADSELLGKQLRVSGVDIDKFSDRVITLRATMDRIEQPTLKFAAALQLVAGVNLSELEANAKRTLVGVNTLLKEGSTNTEFLIGVVDKASDAFVNAGQEIPKFLKDARAEVIKTAAETTKFVDSFKAINGVDFTKLQQSLAITQKDFENFAERAGTSGSKLIEINEMLVDNARQVYGSNGIPAAIKETIKANASIARSATTVLDAFESINGISLDGLEREVRQNLAEVERLFNAGLIGSEQMKSEVAAIREQFNLLGPAAQSGIEPIIQGLERSIPLAQGLADSLSLLGAKPFKELKQDADLAGKAFIKAFQSGKVSGRELVRVFESEVAPAFETAGLRIPNSLILAFEKARGRSELEAARLGDQIGKVLGDSIANSTGDEVLNSVGQVINTIEDRFKEVTETVSQRLNRIAPGTNKPIPGVTFGSDVETLLRNKEDIRKAQLGTRGATTSTASSIGQLNKAMDIIDGRLADLGFKAAFADASFTKFTAIPINKLNESVRTSTTQINSDFASTTAGIDEATASLERFASTTSNIGTRFDISATTTRPTTSDTTSLVTGVGTRTISSGSGARPAGSASRPVFGRFQSGIGFAQQGQFAKLDRGEMVVPRDIARRLRSLGLRQQQDTSPIASIGAAIGQGASFRPGPRNFLPGTGFVGSVIIGRTRPTASLTNAGFQFVPGFGTVPTASLAAATGNSDILGGENSQREMQKRVVTLVRGAITRRDLTRDISCATALTNKGQPSTGGS